LFGWDSFLRQIARTANPAAGERRISAIARAARVFDLEDLPREVP